MYEIRIDRDDHGQWRAREVNGQSCMICGGHKALFGFNFKWPEAGQSFDAAMCFGCIGNVIDQSNTAESLADDEQD